MLKFFIVLLALLLILTLKFLKLITKIWLKIFVLMLEIAAIIVVLALIFILSGGIKRHADKKRNHCFLSDFSGRL